MSKMNTEPQREETKPTTQFTHRKLLLNRESLRILSAQRLEQVAGGATRRASGDAYTIDAFCTLLVCL